MTDDHLRTPEPIRLGIFQLTAHSTQETDNVITRRKPAARPANTSPRFFALRLTKDDEAKLDDAKERMAINLGGTPSNPMLFEHLLKFYLERTSTEISTTSHDNKGTSALDI